MGDAQLLTVDLVGKLRNHPPELTPRLQHWLPPMPQATGDAQLLTTLFSISCASRVLAQELAGVVAALADLSPL